MSKVCAITGLSGYVGSQIARKVRDNGYTVLSLGRKQAGPDAFIPWSLSAQTSVAEELKKRSVQALVHVAWDLTLVKPADMQRVNVDGSLRLLNDAVKAGVERLVFISSISAFPEAKSHYGQTKLAVEQAFAKEGGVVIRPGLVFGSDTRGMYGALVQQVQKSKTVPLIGDGSYAQYLVHEDDIASAVLAALELPTAPPEPVTVADSKPWPLKTLLQEIGKKHSRTVKFVPVPAAPLYWFIKTGEAVGLKLPFRSDSLRSLLHQNKSPRLNAPELLNVKPRAF